MKLLVDHCVSRVVAAQLREAGHDVVWVGDWPRDPGDPAIMAHAAAEERVLITIDKGFGELAIAFALPHAGIIRLVEIRAIEQAAFLRRVIAEYEEDLLRGAIVTVDERRTRVRPFRSPDE